MVTHVASFAAVLQNSILNTGDQTADDAAGLLRLRIGHIIVTHALDTIRCGHSRGCHRHLTVEYGIQCFFGRIANTFVQLVTSNWVRCAAELYTMNRTSIRYTWKPHT